MDKKKKTEEISIKKFVNDINELIDVKSKIDNIKLTIKVNKDKQMICEEMQVMIDCLNKNPDSFFWVKHFDHIKPAVENCTFDFDWEWINEYMDRIKDYEILELFTDFITTKCIIDAGIPKWIEWQQEYPNHDLLINQIKAKFEYLKKHKFSIKNLQESKNNNESTKVKEIIQWQTYSSDLFYWVQSYKKEQIKFENIKKLVKENFNNQNGKPFKEFAENYIDQAISNLLNNTKSKGKSKHGEIIDKIISISDNEIKIKNEIIAFHFVKNKFIDESHKQIFIELFKDIL